MWHNGKNSIHPAGGHTMNRKRIRQMNTALLRRLTGRPTAESISAASPCWSGWRVRTTSSALRPFTTAPGCAAATCWSCADRSWRSFPAESRRWGGCTLPMTLPGGSCSRRRRPLRPMTPGRCFSCHFYRCFLPPNGRSCPLTRHGISTFYRRQRRRITPAAPAIDRCCGSGSGSTSMR